MAYLVVPAEGGNLSFVLQGEDGLGTFAWEMKTLFNDVAVIHSGKSGLSGPLAGWLSHSGVVLLSDAFRAGLIWSGRESAKKGVGTFGKFGETMLPHDAPYLVEDDDFKEGFVSRLVAPALFRPLSESPVRVSLRVRDALFFAPAVCGMDWPARARVEKADLFRVLGGTADRDGCSVLSFKRRAKELDLFAEAR